MRSRSALPATTAQPTGRPRPRLASRPAPERPLAGEGYGGSALSRRIRVLAAGPRLSGAGRGQECGQVEPAEAVGVDDRIDLGDLAVEDGEGDDRDGPLGRGDDDSCATVDQR